MKLYRISTIYLSLVG